MATIGIDDHGRPMDLDDFLDSENVEGYRYELVRGILFAEDMEAETHGQVVSNHYQLGCLDSERHPGRMLRLGGGANFLLVRPESVSALRPDFALVLRSALKDVEGRRKPSLVAEVVSKTSRDRDLRVKREEYLAYGLDEYWIVDYLNREMTVLVRDGDTWRERPCPDGRPIPSLVLPGLEATTADLWADLDKYPDAD